MTEIINSFPGYEYVKGEDGRYHNMYRGTDLGFGGYVYFEPGIYTNVALLDAASMHPTSIVLLNKLGEFTKVYADLRAARIFIKHKDYESAGKLFDGKLKKYLESEEEAEELSSALKLPLNAFFGISFASYDNPARDKRDVNNIIALRGALFMRTLQDEVKARGFNIVHIKTDSCKIPNATPEIIEFVKEFGKKYGYEMEHEATYDRMCLVNGSTYIAKYDEYGIRNKGGKHANEWTATAAQFQVPYVFKTLFSGEEVNFEDLCEVKSVKEGEIYIDMNEGLSEEEHNYVFVGRVGQFTPIKPGCGGGVLYREKDGKYYAVTGTKGYRWMESMMVRDLNKFDDIDMSYYERLCDEAIEAIEQYGSYDWFVSDEFHYEEDWSKYMNEPTGDPDEVPFEGSHVVERR